MNAHTQQGTKLYLLASKSEVAFESVRIQEDSNSASDSSGRKIVSESSNDDTVVTVSSGDLTEDSLKDVSMHFSLSFLLYIWCCSWWCGPCRYRQLSYRNRKKHIGHRWHLGSSTKLGFRFGRPWIYFEVRRGRERWYYLLKPRKTDLTHNLEE